MPRESNTAQRQREIAQGMIEVMASEGSYGSASITQIARAAGLTPGLVHYHFKAKQDILVVALSLLARRHAEALDKAAARGVSPADKLEAFIDAHVGVGAHADPQALACWIVITGEALRQQIVRQAHEAVLADHVERLETIIVEGCEVGDFDCLDPRAAASALVATVQGYFVMAATARALIPTGSAAPATKKMANGLLCPKEGPCRLVRRLD